MESGLGQRLNTDTPSLRCDPDDRVRRRLRRKFRWGLTGRWILWSLTSGAALVWWGLSVSAAETVDSAVKHGSTHSAIVSRVDVDEDDATKVYVQAAGHTYLISDDVPIWDWRQLVESFKDADYKVGDRVEIALGLLDPEKVEAYDIARYDSFSWLHALLGLPFLIGLIAAARKLLTRNLLLSDGARWQLWRTRRAFTVTVVEVRERRPPRVVRYAETVLSWFSDHTHEHHHLVLEANGRTFFWEAKSDGDITVEPGATFEVFGRLRRRGWIVALTEPVLYPVARLD